MPVEVDVAHAQGHELAPAHAAQSKCEDDVATPAAFTGQRVQLGRGEVHMPFGLLARQLHPARMIRVDHAASHGVVEDPGEDAVCPQCDAGAALRRYVSNPFLHIVSGHHADGHVSPCGLDPDAP